MILNKKIKLIDDISDSTAIPVRYPNLNQSSTHSQSKKPKKNADSKVSIFRPVRYITLRAARIRA